MDAVDAAMFTAHASQGPNTFYWDEGNIDASSSDPANVEVGGADFSILKANYGYNGGINSVVEFMFGFTGRMYDDETGLQNNLNRWYDAKVGRWISEDPIGFAAGDANIYRYFGNGPTNFIDPSGLHYEVGHDSDEIYAPGHGPNAPTSCDPNGTCQWEQALKDQHENEHGDSGGSGNNGNNNGNGTIRGETEEDRRRRRIRDTEKDPFPRPREKAGCLEYFAVCTERGFAIIFTPANVNPYPLNFDSTIVMCAGFAATPPVPIPGPPKQPTPIKGVLNPGPLTVPRKNFNTPDDGFGPWGLAP